ncbi:MAG: hypothetical protein JW927_07955 [Deltaproteobacteria bacterium]|nr:hypothetical protein [Deltaproteobacteria bacterium]
MRYVKISAKVERRIEELRQSGKTGKSIAQKADSIIENLKSGAFLEYTENSGAFTKYGEKRLKGCRKYDFGNGYRLITLQKDAMILVPFLGTHDECDRWLETNNRSKHIAEGKGTMVSVPDRIEEYEDSDITSCYEEDELSTDDDIQFDLDEQILRTVFCGIVNGAKKRVM